MIKASEMSTGLVADPKSLGGLRERAIKDPEGTLKEAARQFETIFMNIIMKSMRTEASGKSLFDNEGTRVFTGLLDEEFSKKWANSGGMGLADLMVKQLSQKHTTQHKQTGFEVKNSPNLPLKQA
ncbi:MAG: rod-binding protein [Betaproteobacteria bacterium]